MRRLQASTGYRPDSPGPKPRVRGRPLPLEGPGLVGQHACHCEPDRDRDDDEAGLDTVGERLGRVPVDQVEHGSVGGHARHHDDDGGHGDRDPWHMHPGRDHAAMSPTSRHAPAAAACVTTPTSTSWRRTTLATIPTPAAASAIGHGLLNMSANPSTPTKLATNRRSSRTPADSAIRFPGSGDRPTMADTPQTASAADVSSIRACVSRATPAEKSSFARSRAPVTRAKPGMRKRTAETYPAWWSAFVAPRECSPCTRVRYAMQATVAASMVTPNWL